MVDEYKVELEVFEGPLDLLLYLIKKDEVDIYNIPIETITTQYNEYLNLMRMLDLTIAGEFIVMAATLMMIKSRMLLPVEDREEMEEEEEDPRWELVRQLVEYKKFKDAAIHLQEKEYNQENVFGAASTDRAALDMPEDVGVTLRDVSLFDLISAFNDVLKRVPTEEIGHLAVERFTVADKIEILLSELRERESIPFTDLFNEAATRHEIVCTFLALLELIRLRQAAAKQESVFGKIVIARGEGLDIGMAAAPVAQEEVTE